MATICRSHRSPRRLAMIHEEATKLEKDTIKLEKEAKDKEMKLASIRAALTMEQRLREDINKEAKSKGWWNNSQKSKSNDLLGKSKTKPHYDLKTSRSFSSCSLKTTTTENELLGRISQDLRFDEEYTFDDSKINSSFKRASNMLLSSFDSDTTSDRTKLTQSSSSACPTDTQTSVGASPRRPAGDDSLCMGSQTEHYCPVAVDVIAPPPPIREGTYFDHLLAQAHMIPRRSAYEDFRL